jgi:hypothetical protein
MEEILNNIEKLKISQHKAEFDSWFQKAKQDFLAK